MDNTKENSISSTSIPHVLVSLDSLKSPKFNSQSNTITFRRVNMLKMKLENLKTKSHFTKMQEMQQSPKISVISKLLTSPTAASLTPKSAYISKIKLDTEPKTKAKSGPVINYDLIKSLEDFAIFKALNLGEKTENKPEQSFDLPRGNDMYSKGLDYIKKKEANRKAREEEVNKERLEICTFTPNIGKAVKKVKKEQVGDFKGLTYKAISPHVNKIGYLSGCNYEALKIKCRRS